MRRRVIGAILVLVLLMGGLPYLMGYVIEQQAKRWVSLLSPVKGFDITLLKYRRGWLHSSAKFLIQLPNKQPGQKNDSPGFVMDSQIVHGPLIFTESAAGNISLDVGRGFIKSLLTIPHEHHLFFRQYLDQTALLDTFFLVHLSGTVEFEAKSPKFSYHDAANQWMVKGSDLVFKGKLSRNRSSVRVSTVLNKLIISHQGVALNFAEVAMNNRYHKGDAGLWEGNSTMKWPFFTLSIEGRERLIGEGIEAVFHNHVQDDIVNIVTNFQVDKLIFDEIAYGPGEYGLAINNLGAAALGDLFKRVRPLAFDEPVAAVSSNQPDVRSLLFLLLGHGLQIQLTPFALQTPDGELSLRAWLTLPNVHGESLNPRANFMYLWHKADCYIGAVFPRAGLARLLGLLEAMPSQSSNSSQSQSSMGLLSKRLLKSLGLSASSQRTSLSVNKKIDRWEHKGWIKEEAGHYEMAFDYKGGEFYINGRLLKG